MKIRIKYGEDTSPKIESSEYFEDSIFSDVYHKAYTILGSIIESSNSVNKENGHYFNLPLEAPNNIIAFTGDRGSGKTSTMLSFIKSLPKNKKSFLDESTKTGWKSYTFEILDVIDPTTFTEAHNVLEVVLGKMFSQFKHKIEDREHSCFSNSNMVALKRELFSKFEQVRKDLYYQDCKEKEDSIDQFTSYSCVTSLRNDLCELVQCYIRFMNDDQKGNRKLVIPIDDLDLNIKNAYPMLEQIRKYLMCPDIVIVMALSLDQMKDACILNFLNDYEHKLKHYNDELHKNHILDLSDRYLIKYLPLSHRIHVLGIDSLRKIDIEIEESKDKTISGISLAEFLLEEILTHTGYLFYNKKGIPSPIVPTNLREMIMLLNMLHSMEAKKDLEVSSTIDLDRLIWNRAQFKRYFFQNWVPRSIKADQQEKLIQLMEEPAETFNGQVVELIKTLFDKNLNLSRLKVLTNNKNFLYSYSLADSMCLLNEVEPYLKDKDEINLIFAIKTILSMRLYEAYDILDLPLVKKVRDESLSQKRSELNITSPFDNFTDYWKLKGHILFSPYNKIIPGHGTENRRLDYRRIDVDFLRKLKEEKAPLFQFFFLTTQFYRTEDEKKTQEHDQDFRSQDIIPLNTGICRFDNNIKSGYFHILLIFDRLLEIYNLMDFKIELDGEKPTSFWNLFFKAFEIGIFDSLNTETYRIPHSFKDYYRVIDQKALDSLISLKTDWMRQKSKDHLTMDIFEMLLDENSLLSALFCHIRKVRENLYSTLIFRNTAYWDIIIRTAKYSKYDSDIWSKYETLFTEISKIQLKVYDPGNITFDYLKPLTKNLKELLQDNDRDLTESSLIMQVLKLNSDPKRMNISKDEYDSTIIKDSGNLSLIAQKNSILALFKEKWKIEKEEEDSIKNLINSYKSKFDAINKIQNENERLNVLNNLLETIKAEFQATPNK